MNCKHVNVKNITLLVVASVTLVQSNKKGFRYTIKQIFNVNCSLIHFIHLFVIITICITKNKDFDKC